MADECFPWPIKILISLRIDVLFLDMNHFDLEIRQTLIFRELRNTEGEIDRRPSDLSSFYPVSLYESN